MELEYHRRLPPELLVEMHKCLPLDNQIYVLVNVSKTFVLNNSTRMRRNIQRIKTSLNEYIGTLVNDGDGREELEIHKEIEWKSELDALLRYGNWLTSAREFRMHEDSGIIIGKTVEELLLHLTNSRSTQMTLNYVRILFGNGQLPIPTIIKTLFNKKDEYYLNGGRFLFESVELETEDGQILQIFDGEFEEYSSFTALKLFLMNKMEPNNLFRILIDVDSSEKFIQALIFSKWNMQSFDIANFIKEEGRVGNDQIEKNGNELEALSDISWDQNLDIFLRRGAGFTQFRHFTTKQYSILRHPRIYVDFLIDFILKTKHPEDFIESIEMNLRSISLYIEKIWEIFYCSSCVTKGEKFINFGGQKLHVLSAKIVESNSKLEFTLVNGPTNGAYLFDVEVKFGNEDERFKQIVGIKIQKRKNDGDIVELKCEDQIGQGKKSKTTNDDDGEDGPTCSAKLMKQ